MKQITHGDDGQTMGTAKGRIAHAAGKKQSTRLSAYSSAQSAEPVRLRRIAFNALNL
jgi:hypothetical protein